MQGQEKTSSQNKKRTSLNLTLKARQNPLVIVGLCMAPFLIQVDQGKGQVLSLSQSERKSSFLVEDSLKIETQLEEIARNASSYFKD